MKKFKFLAFCASMLFLLVLGGCSDDNNEVTPGEGPGSEVTIEIESEKGMRVVPFMRLRLLFP